jgi:hypothetical protein
VWLTFFSANVQRTGKLLLKLGFMYGGGWVSKRKEGGKVGSTNASGSWFEDRQSNERIDKINQGKLRQKKHELIRQKFLEANREIKLALTIDAQHGQDVGRLFEEDEEDEDDEDDDDAEAEADDNGDQDRKNQRSNEPASRLVSLLLEIARKYYQKAVAPVSASSSSSVPTSRSTAPASSSSSQEQQSPSDATAIKKKKVERYWKVLATLVICEAVHEHLRDPSSPATPTPARSLRQLSSSPSRANMLRYSRNSAPNKVQVSRPSGILTSVQLYKNT